MPEYGTPIPSSLVSEAFLTAAVMMRRGEATGGGVVTENARSSAMRFAELYPNPWVPQDEAIVRRVESLMKVPFHMLEQDDRHHRLVLGTQRNKASLGLTPFYANRAARAAAEGDEWSYWRDLWTSHVNMIHPPLQPR